MYPFISFFGRSIPTYGLCMAFGIALTLFLAIRRGRTAGIRSEDIIIVAASALLAALIGGSILYVFVTYPIGQIIAFIRAGEFTFLSSGIVFYGGLLGGLVGAFIGIKIAQCDATALEKTLVPFIPLGHAVGRIGCVMAGCCHGMEYDGPFALYYTHSVTGLDPAQGYFPVQLLEGLLNCVLCMVLLLLSKKDSRPFDLIFCHLGWYSVERFVLECLRGDAVRGTYGALSTSQWISLLLLAVCSCWLARRCSRPRT